MKKIATFDHAKPNIVNHIAGQAEKKFQRLYRCFQGQCLNGNKILSSPKIIIPVYTITMVAAEPEVISCHRVRLFFDVATKITYM